MCRQQDKLNNVNAKIDYYERLYFDRIEQGNERHPMNDDLKVVRNLLVMYYGMKKELERDVTQR